MRVILCGKDALKYRIIDDVDQLELINNNEEIVVGKGKLLNLEFFKTSDYSNINIQDFDEKWERLRDWLNEYLQFQDKLKNANSRVSGVFTTINFIDIKDVLKKMEDLETKEIVNGK